MTIEYAYADLLALRRQLGSRMNVREDDLAYYPRVFADGQEAYAVIAKDGPDVAAFEADVLPNCNKPLTIVLGRTDTHDFVTPATWLGRTLPASHADKPPAAFVTAEAAGEWVAAGDARGRIKAIDQQALPYDAEDPDTYWVPRPTWRLAAPAGMQNLIVAAWIETSQQAAMSGMLDMQLWTWVDPAAGYAPCPPDTAGAVFIAPPAGLWRYPTVNTLVKMADAVELRGAEPAGETGYGPRMRLAFRYDERLSDAEAREAVLDGRFGQVFEITISDGMPITTAAQAIATFKLVTRTMF